MTDDLVKRLRDWEHVWPDDMEKPAGHLYEDAADRIEELIAERDEAWKRAAHAEKMWGKTEVKLAKLTKAADRVHDSYWNNTDGIIVGMFELGEAVRASRTALAELTGGKDE